MLENYRGLKDKLDLLDAAVSMHAGSVIVTIALFLRRSLRPKIFFAHMKRRQKACQVLFFVGLLAEPKLLQHYYAYLLQRHEWDELVSFLTAIMWYEVGVDAPTSADACSRS